MTEAPKRGYSMRIFLAEGTPSGLRFVEKTNWSGQGMVCPRPRFATMKSRQEFGRAGVYVLLEQPEGSELPTAYIGEGDPVRQRLEQHNSLKAFWTVAYVFTSKDGNLNKAHIEYLEHRLVALATEAKRCKLDNGNRPGKPSLSEADQADADSFLDEMLLCFPVLGVTIFDKPQAQQPSQLLFQITGKGAVANGYESEDGFVVRAGSTVVQKFVDSIGPHIPPLRDELVNSGVLVLDGAFYRFAQDYEFSSPSTAGSLVCGSNLNGRDFWKTTDGRTLKQVQEALSGMPL